MRLQKYFVVTAAYSISLDFDADIELKSVRVRTRIDDPHLAFAEHIGLRAREGKRRRIGREQPRNAGFEQFQLGVGRVHGFPLPFAPTISETPPAWKDAVTFLSATIAPNRLSTRSRMTASIRSLAASCPVPLNAGGAP